MKYLMTIVGGSCFLVVLVYGLMQDYQLPTILIRAVAAMLASAFLVRWWARLLTTQRQLAYAKAMEVAQAHAAAQENTGEESTGDARPPEG